jgi:hypothetical protein
MRCRSVPLVALLVLTAVPRQAPAQEEAPSIVIRVRSIDGLIDDAKYLLAQVGQEELGKQIDGFIKSQVGAKGLEGIDTKRPLGFYGTVGPNGVDSTGVAMVPVSDEKTFVALLDRLNLGVKKNDDGTYNFTPPGAPTEGFFRFANKYCYLTALNKAAIDKGKLLDPAMLSENPSAAFSTTIRFDRIPDSIKQVALSQFELKLADEQDKKIPNETETQHKFRIALLNHISGRVKQLLSQGQELKFRFDVDRKTHELFVDLSLTGKPGSKLASELAELGQSKSLFAGPVGVDSAMNLLLHASLPADVQKAFGPVIDEGFRQGLEKEKDEGRREAARKFLDVLGPTLKSGEFDFMGSMRGPNADKHYALLVGVKVKDGKAIDQSFRDMAKSFREEEQAKIKFDAETVAGIKVHRFDITKKDLNETAQALFGCRAVCFRRRWPGGAQGGPVGQAAGGTGFSVRNVDQASGARHGARKSAAGQVPGRGLCQRQGQRPHPPDGRGRQSAQGPLRHEVLGDEVLCPTGRGQEGGRAVSVCARQRRPLARRRIIGLAGPIAPARPSGRCGSMRRGNGLVQRDRDSPFRSRLYFYCSSSSNLRGCPGLISISRYDKSLSNGSIAQDRAKGRAAAASMDFASASPLQDGGLSSEPGAPSIVYWNRAPADLETVSRQFVFLRRQARG